MLTSPSCATRRSRHCSESLRRLLLLCLLLFLPLWFIVSVAVEHSVRVVNTIGCCRGLAALEIFSGSRTRLFNSATPGGTVSLLGRPFSYQSAVESAVVIVSALDENSIIIL
jgi:hypothetical protein